MQGNRLQSRRLKICLAASSLFLFSTGGRAQDGKMSAPSSPPTSEAMPEMRVLADLIRDLQSQVQTLNSQLGELRTQEQRTSEEARELRRELDSAKTQPAVANAVMNSSASVPQAGYSSPSKPPSPSASTSTQDQAAPDRAARSDEDQQLTDGKLTDLYQTKVESGSKYRLRLSGILLLNMYDNHGVMENQDSPWFAEPPQTEPEFVTSSSFGGTIRQSQIRLQAFGPDVAGARTSADLQLDFAGGFPNAANGATMGIMRLRTGTIRLDWNNTSIVAGQDRLFFAPLAPTSLATLATPALAYAGNLWSWTPQVRIEHRIALSDTSSLSVQAGILDSQSGDFPDDPFIRYMTWGEESGQPAYATRVAWSHRLFRQNFTVGFAGYYGRQNWGFNRIVDGWAGTTDVTLPLGKLFEFTGEFYRGRAMAGLGGGIGQTVLIAGPFDDPATLIKGLDSMGGWAQIKFKPRANFEINGGIGVDNPFAHELRNFEANPAYLGSYTRNLSPLVNFIYQIRSDILFSTEFRRLQTSVLDSNTFTGNHVNFSLGYIF